MSETLKKKNQEMKSDQPIAPEIVVDTAEKSKSKYQKYKSIQFYIEYESFDESFKIAGVSNQPNFGNIGDYHDNYKDKVKDKFEPYSDVEMNIIYGGDKWDYIFGCRVNSLDNLPEGMTGVDTGIKDFAVITFRSETFEKLVGDADGPGEGMEDAADYIKNVWFPEHADEVDFLMPEHHIYKMYNDMDSGGCWGIGVYRNTSKENPEMCHYIPLKSENHYIDKHKYCCQNTTQNYLDHMIPVPDDFNVNSSCLSGVSKQEFIIGLKQLTDIIKSMYSDMIIYPAEYGLPLVEDIRIEGKYTTNAINAFSSPNRLITVLHVLAHCGELTDNGKLIVDINKFNEMCKSSKVVNKYMILNRLCRFGFKIPEFDGKGFYKDADWFTISYPDNDNIIKVMYGYMINASQRQDGLHQLHYYLSIAKENLPNDLRQNIFSEYLSGEEKEFFIRLDDVMKELGFTCRSDVPSSSSSPAYFSLAYYKKPKEKQYFMRCYSDYGKLRIIYKLDHIGNYTSIIEKMPETIKQTFRHSSCPTKFMGQCSDSDPCNYRRQWTLDGTTYKLCNYGGHFTITDFNPDHIEYYKQFLSYELEEDKQAKKR